MGWAIAFSMFGLAFPLSAIAVARDLQLAQADVIDGFVASCTGNLDGTGQCINQETGQRFTCVVIPGQVIDCKSRLSNPFQCVWISGVQANYADFWCDPQVDALLRSEISAKQFDVPLGPSLGPGPSGNSFPANDLNSDRFTHDRFKVEELKPDDPFGSKNPPVAPTPGSLAPQDSGPNQTSPSVLSL